MAITKIINKANNEFIFEKTYKFIKNHSEYEQIHHYEIISKSDKIILELRGHYGEEANYFYLDKVPAKEYKKDPYDILARFDKVTDKESLELDQETYNQFSSKKKIESKLICNDNRDQNDKMLLEQAFFIFEDTLIVTAFREDQEDLFEEIYGGDFVTSLIDLDEINKSLWHQAYE
ncbi:hypothetical protein EZV73_26505 [Acidaminobacter sp. JC074]|uniref:hypothetical protein n=1 Tax=Acidaminobacter sp. JC074 TaxID=2530199 RepID=UPI001F0D1BD2|nr:hypothetical protein [Acidaminobacter sp. JC074]MCH4891158.1 hypothetical protein [Acidaminobacter sp. JC074]